MERHLSLPLRHLASHSVLLPLLLGYFSPGPVVCLWDPVTAYSCLPWLLACGKVFKTLWDCPLLPPTSSSPIPIGIERCGHCKLRIPIVSALCICCSLSISHHSHSFFEAPWEAPPTQKGVETAFRIFLRLRLPQGCCLISLHTFSLSQRLLQLLWRENLGHSLV